MKNPTTAFLFDIGNVIIRFDFRLAIGRVADRCTLAPEHILPNLQPLTDQLEMGQLGVLEFVEAAAEVTGFSGTPEEFIAAFEDIFELNQPIADLIEKLSEAKTPLFLLSNTNAIHVPFFYEKIPSFREIRRCDLFLRIGLHEASSENFRNRDQETRLRGRHDNLHRRSSSKL